MLLFFNNTVDSGPTGVNLDPFWRPGSAGNGRVWIRGTTSVPLQEVQWQVNDSDWITVRTNVLAGDTLTFPITGDGPSEWGTTDVVHIAQHVNGYYYSTEPMTEPVFVHIDGQRVPRVLSLIDLDGTAAGWYYSGETLYFSTIQNNMPDLVRAIQDPVFEQGKTYEVRIRVKANDVYSNVVEETFSWIYVVRNQVDRYLQILLPTVFARCNCFSSLYTTYAKRFADLLIFFEDIGAQFFPHLATWSINMWEDQVGLPNSSGLSLETRRNLVLARRTVTEGRADFYDTIASITGGQAVVTNDFGLNRIDVTLPVASTNPQLQETVVELVNSLKPAGVVVNVSYDAFYAGISQAGDRI